jgi:immune inhibitor A
VWINEMVDLSQYAGQNLTLRFEYVTDSNVTGEGFLLDDLSIPRDWLLQ